MLPGEKKKLAGTISVSVVCDERGSAQDYYVLDALAIPSLNRDVNILSNQVKQVSKLFYWNMFFWKPRIIKPFLKQCCKYYKSFSVQNIYGQKHCWVKKMLVRKKIVYLLQLSFQGWLVTCTLNTAVFRCLTPLRMWLMSACNLWDLNAKAYRVKKSLSICGLTSYVLNDKNKIPEYFCKRRKT